MESTYSEFGSSIAILAPFVGEASVARIVILVLLSAVVWVPIWLLGGQIRALAAERKSAEIQRRRYDTYLRIEFATREIRVELPVAQRLVLNDEIMTRAAAKTIYSARPGGGRSWEDKVMITELLERLDRLAIGAGMDVIDVEVWQRMSGNTVVSLCRLLRNFIEVSREGRVNRYYALSQIDRVFQRMLNESSVQLAVSEEAMPASRSGR